MNLKEKNPWKAGFALLLILTVFLAYVNYPGYDTVEAREAILSSKEGLAVQILDEETVEGYTVCQLRIGDKIGCALFRETLGKTRFQWFVTTSSDRLMESFSVGEETYLILVCGNPEARTAVMHFYDYSTGTYSAADPIDMESRQLIVTPHRAELGSYDHTDYLNSNGDPL